MKAAAQEASPVFHDMQAHPGAALGVGGEALAIVPDL